MTDTQASEPLTDPATLKTRLLAAPETRRKYEAQAPGLAVARELIGARSSQHLLQQAVHRRRQATHQRPPRRAAADAGCRGRHGGHAAEIVEKGMIAD